MPELRLLGRANVIKAGEGSKQRTVEIVAYTGGPLTSQGEYGWDYPVICDLEGFSWGNGKLPLLDNHGPNFFSNEKMRDAVAGQSQNVRVEKGELRLSGNLFENPAGKAITELADQGLSWQTSIGARVLEKKFVPEGAKETVNSREWDGPCYIATKTRLREVSFVVLGDDANTSAIIAKYVEGKKMPDIAAAKKCGMSASDEDFKLWCDEQGYGDPGAMTTRMAAKIRTEYDDMRAGEDVDEESDPDEDEDKKPEVEASEDDEEKVDASVDDDGVPDEGAKKGTRAKARAGWKNGRSAAAIRAEAVRVARIDEILARNPGLKIPVLSNTGKEIQADLKTHAILNGWTPKRTQLEMVRASRQQPGPFWYSPSKPELTEAVIEAGLFQAAGGRNPTEMNDDSFFEAGATAQRQHAVARDLKIRAKREMARYDDKTCQAAHDLFGRSTGGNSSIGALTLHRVLLLGAQSQGYRGDMMAVNDGNLEEVLRYNFDRNARRTIRAEGASTISVPSVLANVLNKYLLYGYLHTDMSWRETCQIVPTKDFKPILGLNLSGDFLFKKLNADGQIQNATLTDEAYTNQIDTYARKLGLPRQTIINDDVSALTTVPMLIGIGCNDGISLGYWTYFLTNPNWPAAQARGDGNPFFYARTVATSTFGGGACNSNLVPSGATSALSSSALQLAAQLFYKQVKPNGQPLGVMPAILLYPPELDQTAIELMNAAFLVYGGSSASRQPNTNIWQGRFKPVMCPYLSNSAIANYSTTAWYLFAEPNRMPAMQTAFLNGQETPTVQTAQANFNELGIDIRGFHDYGFAFQNPRGAVKSPGA
jgi:Mu-like prophage major head subunit gpT